MDFSKPRRLQVTSKRDHLVAAAPLLVIIYIYCYSVHYKTMRPFPPFVSSFVPLLLLLLLSRHNGSLQAVHPGKFLSASLCFTAYTNTETRGNKRKRKDTNEEAKSARCDF